jgi:hypothetical protein
MRARVVPAGIALLLAFAGCASILQIEPGVLDESSPASSSSGGHASECATPSDCPTPPFADCRTVACDAHRCVLTDAAARAPTTSQIAGDCQQIECDGHGLVRSAAVDDPRDDGRDCTADTCAEGVPANTPKAAGTPCQQGGGAVCNGTGDCVGCLSDTDCAGQICKASSCVPPGCANNVKDGGETDKDCGGPCDPCADNRHCVIGADCVSLVCVSKVCKSPTCGDAVKNGSEADVDCGGGCPPCADNKACAVANDCAGGVCNGQLCCTPALDAITCLGRCGVVTNTCGQPITCGACGGATTCVQTFCVCVPDPTTTTCAGKCGSIANNCGQTLDCGPCPP